MSDLWNLKLFYYFFDLPRIEIDVNTMITFIGLVDVIWKSLKHTAPRQKGYRYTIILWQFWLERIFAFEHLNTFLKSHRLRIIHPTTSRWLLTCPDKIAPEIDRSERPLPVRSGYYRLFYFIFLWVFNVSLDFGTKPYEIEVLNNILWNEIRWNS